RPTTLKPTPPPPTVIGLGTKNKFLSLPPGAGFLGEGGGRGVSEAGAAGASCVGMKSPSSTTARLPACAAPSIAIKIVRTTRSTLLQSGSVPQLECATACHGPMIGFRKSFMPGTLGYAYDMPA